MASQLYNYTPAELQKVVDSSSSYKDVLRNLGMCDHGSNYDTLKKILDEYDIELTKLFENRKKINKEALKNLHKKKSKSLEEILVENSTYTSGHNLKKKILDANLKEYKCERCGLTEWQEEKIPLQIHHKNGIHNDNRIENIEFLCPNCHALTDTFAGKNVDHSKQKTKTKKQRKPAQKGVSEDGQRLYDGYGNYKILCPVCQKKFMNKTAKTCRICRDKERLRPKISKEDLFEIMKTNTYYSAADLLGVDKKTVSHWHKYYINEDNKNNSEYKFIGSDKTPSRDVLKIKIRTMSFVQIGKEYGVTDN